MFPMVADLKHTGKEKKNEKRASGILRHITYHPVSHTNQTSVVTCESSAH